LIVWDNGPAKDVADHRVHRTALHRRALLQPAMEVVIDPREELPHERMISLRL
jgi:hypothetical protein